MEKNIPEKSFVSVAIPTEMRDRLDALAEETNRSRAGYIRQILRRYFRYLDTRDDPDGPRVDWDIT